MQQPKTAQATALRGLWVAALALGLAATLGAAEPTAPPALDGPVTPKPAEAGEGGWTLSLPGKAPLTLPDLGGPGRPLAPVKEAALYAGHTVNWRDKARMLELSNVAGKKLRLVLGDDALYDGSLRVPLSGPLDLAAGTPCLDPEALRLALERLSGRAPDFQPATAPEAALARARWLPEPQAPQRPPTATPTPGPQAHVAAKPLNGGKMRAIVLDAGHGGNDPGARGLRGLYEKEVCLDITLRLGRELAKRAPDLKVVYTRDDDRYLSLRERTEIANKADADLFVSIHNNASTNRSSRGTQVFFYDSQTSDRAAMDLVSRENEEANELEILMTDLAKSLVRDQSIRMASKVQENLGTALRLKHRDLSYAPFYVLARTKMPAVLVEVAFLTHPEEERLLNDPDFRQNVAESLATGLLEYRRLMESAR